MTSKIEIIDSTAAHARELAKTLRPKDRLEAERAGLDPEKAVFSSYRKALYRKTALIDDHVAAMWGVWGSFLGFFGDVYLITGTEVEKVSPIRFAKIYISEVKKMKGMFPCLENFVDAGYTEAVRMLRLAGFKIEGPVTVNNHDFYHFSMTGDV